MTRFRSILIALVAVALSAGAVLAGRPMPTASDSGLGTASDAARSGLETAEEAAGKTVPVRADEDDEADTDEDADAATHPDNHGKLVSEAAHLETLPAGFDNRGEYVSSIAKANHGQVTATDKKAGHGKPDDVGKPEGAGKPSN